MTETTRTEEKDSKDIVRAANARIKLRRKMESLLGEYVDESVHQGLETSFEDFLVYLFHSEGVNVLTYIEGHSTLVAIEDRLTELQELATAHRRLSGNAAVFHNQIKQLESAQRKILAEMK